MTTDEARALIGGTVALRQLPSPSIRFAYPDESEWRVPAPVSVTVCDVAVVGGTLCLIGSDGRAYPLESHEVVG